jgi:hypothetical protein
MSETAKSRERFPEYFIHVTDYGGEYYYRERPWEWPTFRIQVMNRGPFYQIERAICWDPPPGRDWKRGFTMGHSDFDSHIWFRMRRMEWSS